MDRIFETLRSSVDNDARKAASAELRQFQQTNAEEFLDYTFRCIASAQTAPELRFFAAAVVLAFVEESWHGAVTKEGQLRHTQQYVALALSQPFPSLLLARKVATIIAVMARRGSGKAPAPGQLPPLMDAVATAYTQCLYQRCIDNNNNNNHALTAEGEGLLPQLLLLLHIFLKEAQTKRVGASFETLCKGMVAPLRTVFTALAPYSPLVQYDAYLYLLKAALRVFGFGVFDASFYEFLLTITWQLAEAMDPAEDPVTHLKRARLIDYGVKIQEKMVNYFPSHLHILGTRFFVPTTTAECASGAEQTASSRSLFTLVDCIVATATAQSPRTVSTTAEPLLSEKTVCRAMRLLTFFLTGEDGDAFLAQCLEGLARSTLLLPRLLRNIVVGFLPDCTDNEWETAWHQNPEKLAGDFDIDFDDDSPGSCAEQLFIALTGSSTLAATVLPAAWGLVNDLLSTGADAEVTAALHAIGIGYNTMASAASQDSYLAFLRGKLLPILTAASRADRGGAASLPVLRRVVWLIGMWCESTHELAARREIHAALQGLLQSHGDDVVIVLTTLRTTENFYTDEQFTLAEVTPESVAVVLGAVQRVLAHLKAPTTVRQVACLVSSMVNKGAISVQGEQLLGLFVPATVSFVAQCERDGNGGGGPAQGDSWGDEDDDATGDTNMGVLPHLLETLAEVVKVCRSDAAVWQLFPSVVLACTEPGRTVTPWAEDAAWELLLTMARATTFSRVASEPEAMSMCSFAVEALHWCGVNSERDFETLHLAVRAASALVLLLNETPDVVAAATATIAARPDMSGALISVDAALQYMRMLVETKSEELISACFALLLAAVRTRDEPIRAAVAQHCVRALTSPSVDVQSEPFSVPVAALLALTLRCDASAAVLGEVLRSVAGIPHLTQLLENLVLILDVCPNKLTEKCIGWLLSTLQSAMAGELAPDTGRMVSLAVETAYAPPPNADGEDGEEVRPAAELFLEMIGDEDVTAAEPHTHRVLRLYGSLMEF